MKLEFLKTVPYVCKRWEEVEEKAPDAVFLTEELTGASLSRRETDELSARVYAYLAAKGLGR